APASAPAATNQVVAVAPVPVPDPVPAPQPPPQPVSIQTPTVTPTSTPPPQQADQASQSNAPSSTDASGGQDGSIPPASTAAGQSSGTAAVTQKTLAQRLWSLFMVPSAAVRSLLGGGGPNRVQVWTSIAGPQNGMGSSRPAGQIKALLPATSPLKGPG